MVEEEEYDSDVSDGTVLLTDYVDKPEKIDMKRRRLSNLLDKGNRSDVFEDEHPGCDDVTVNRRSDRSPAKKKNNVDKTLHITKFFESISKNNDAKNRADLDFYQKQVPTDSQMKQSNISKRNSIDIYTDYQIINLDSDDETQNADKAQDHVRKNDETPATNDRINNPISPRKPAPIAHRRASTGIIERNEIQLNINASKTPEENKHSKIRVLEPSAINLSRPSIDFEENNFNCDVISKTIIPNNDNTKSEKESSSDGYKSKTSKLPKLQSANTNSNVTGISTAILDNNPLLSSPSTSKPSLKTDIDRNSSLSNQDSRRDKRFGSYNETQTELKRIKIDTKSTDPVHFNKITPSQVKTTAGAVNGKRGSVDSIDAKSKSTVNSVGSDKATPNKDIQNTSLNTNEKLEVNKICKNVMSDKHKVINVGSERCDVLDDNKARNLKSTTSSVNEKSTPIAKAFNNVCENSEVPETNIIQETSELGCKKDTPKVQTVEVVGAELHKLVISKVIDKQKVDNIQDDQGEALNELETSRLHDEQGTNKVQDKPETTQVEAHDEKVSKVQIENKINEKYDQPKTNEKQLKTNQAQQETRGVLGNSDVRMSSVKQQLNKVQDSQVTTEANKPESKRVQDNQETGKLQIRENLEKREEKITSNTLNKEKSSKRLDITVLAKINDAHETDKIDEQDENIPSQAIETQDRLEIQKVNSENKTTESTNVQETDKGNETTSAANPVGAEDNDRVLKFQVGFFTLVKEYLKDIFPKSAMELHKLIQTLIINTRNGQVQNEVKYCCPKCSLLSNYSSRILNNAENEENKENVDGTQKCGFCNGIRKLHTSYLKRFLGKKYSIGDKKEVVKMVCPGNDHAIQTEQSRRSLAGEIIINNSQTTSEKTTDNESTSLSALGKQSSCSAIVDNDKQVRNLTSTPDNTAANYGAAKKHSLPNKKPSKKISQLDNSVKKDAVNTTSPVASGSDTIKLAGKERSDQDALIIKDNDIFVQSKPGHMDDAASTAHVISNKRKSEEDHKETTEHKRVKTGTDEHNAQVVKNLTATVSQTNIPRNEKNANEWPDKEQIISKHNITSHAHEKLNSSLESHPSNNTGVHSATNSASCDKNTPEEPSNELTKRFQTNAIDRNTHEVCLKSAADADELDKRGKHCSEDINQPIKEVTSENTFSKECQVEVNGNDKGKEKHSNNTGSVPETDEANAKQISNAQRNDKYDEGVLKPLMDCFAKIKNSVKEQESTPKKAQQENTTASESVSKIRSRVRSDRSNSLDSIPNRDHRKIVKKYVCPICTSMYVYASKLLQHMKKSHNQNLTEIPENCDWLECPFCRTLLSNKNYNKHVKQYHIEKNDEKGVIENNNNTNKCKNEKLGTGKNVIRLNGNTESNKTSESGQSKNDCSTPGPPDDATKKQRHSETKYLHLIKRINIGATNKDEREGIHGGENEELGPDAAFTKNSIESEDDPPATTRIIPSHGRTNSTASALHVNHTERCCDESDRSSGLKSVIKQNTTSNETERSPSDYNDENLDSIEDMDVSSIRKYNMHDINETTHGDNNDHGHGDTVKTLKSNTSQESNHNRKDDEDHSRRRFSNDEYNESESSKSRGIDKDVSLTTSCTVENGKQHNNERPIKYKNNGYQSTENTVMSVRGDEQETDSEEDCIKASDYAVKKKQERTTKLFGDENEVSVSSKIKNSRSNKDPRSEYNEPSTHQKERQIPKRGNKKTKRPTSNRKVHRRRGITVEKDTDNAESSDSDWIIANDENSDSHDETFCTIKKQQVVRTLFSDENVQNSRNEESRNHKDGDNQSTKTGVSNDDIDDDTIKSSKHAVKKKKERLSKLFGGDDETSVSNNKNEKDDRQVGIEKSGHRSDRQCSEFEEGDEENAPSIFGQEIPDDDETLKLSKHMVKKRRERISKNFSDDEALVQNNDSNAQMENSDINNAVCHVPIVQDMRTKDVNVSEEYVTKCNVERPEMSGNGTNYANCVNKNGHQGTKCKERGRDCHVDGATVRNDITAVAEEINMNAVNSENKSRDDDQIEINMIDRLLNELASDDQQSGESSHKGNCDNVRKSEVSCESEATSESAVVKNGLESIRVTNVKSVEGKTHVFLCQECNYGTDAYDNAIRHCQNHYNSIEDQATYCNICQINYDTTCFERHQASHDEYMGNIKIKFSYTWLFTNWQMVFENNDISLSEAEEMNVKSIFKTFCVKMTVKENGPWQSAVYLCAKCNTCVPPLNVEQHVQEKCRFVNHPCSVCNLLFSTYELRKHHEIYHTDDASKPFKTIVFNHQNEDSFNSKLIHVKAQSKEKHGTVDIFKCLCGLCFNSLKKFKLHFADCDSELNDGRQCPRCTGIRRFSNTDLEEHLLLHLSSFNYEFRVQRITFQQESIIDSSEREAPSATSDGTDNTTQITYNNEDLNIKTDLLNDESLTQTTDGEDRQESIGNVEDEDIGRQINETDSTTDGVAQVRSNDEDLIVKDELLKDESLTQSTNELNSQEIPDTEKEKTNRDVKEESSQETKKIEESEHAVDTKTSQELMELEESDDPITIKASQEMEVEGSEHLITIEDSDDDDVEIIGESFPNMIQIFPLRYCAERYRKQSGH